MNRIITLLLFLMIATPLSAQAHTTLTSSTPAEGEVLQVQPKEIELVFGTVIEEGSSMVLEGAEQNYELENISINENVMTGSLTEELPNGQYIIVWKIIGEDGHPIEGQVPFGIKAEEAAEEEPAEEESAESETPEEEPAANEQAESPEANESVESSEAGSGLLSTVLLIAAAVLIGFSLYKLFKKKA